MILNMYNISANLLVISQLIANFDIKKLEMNLPSS